MKNSILSGYPEDRLIEVEALRYLYLQDLEATDSRDDKLKRRSLCLLIVGDYLFANTDFQLKLLSNAINLLPKGLKIILKPHPNLDVNPSEYPKINMTVTKEPLLKILPNCDVVYASSVTSAAVDGYCAGKPVITFLNSNTLNLSPLRGHANTFFVSTPTQMVESFKIISRSNFTLKDKQEFFTLDKDLPRWKKLIAATSV
jgi:surface carbohydrate biosynthesis protein (TIGR04326 family)